MANVGLYLLLHSICQKEKEVVALVRVEVRRYSSFVPSRHRSRSSYSNSTGKVSPIHWEVLLASFSRGMVSLCEVLNLA